MPLSPVPGLGDCFDFDPQRTFACIDSTDPNGSACGVGCTGCAWWTGVQNIIGHHINGRRFMRSIGAIGGLKLDTRDSFGMFGDVVGGSVHIFPPRSYKQFGTCYEEASWTECFNYGICDCYPGPSLAWPPCPTGSIPAGFFPDCFTANNSSWMPYFHCRTKNENSNRTWDIADHNLSYDQMNSIRADGVKCTNNWLVLCIGRVLSDPGCDYELSPYFEMDRFINATQAVGEQLWDTAHIYWYAPQFVIQDYFDERLIGLYAAKNAILKRLEDTDLPVMFDQMDNPQWSTGGSLDKWSRGFSVDNVVDAPEVKSISDGPYYPNSYLLPSGTPTQVRLKIISANVSMSMVLHRLQGRVDPPGDLNPLPENVWPSIRFHIDVEAVPVFPEGVYNDAKLIGIITGDKSLVLIDSDGRRTDFPITTEWRGGRGARVADEWEDVWDSGHWTPSHDWGKSCALAWGINHADGGLGYKIPGRPLKLDGVETVKKTYDGYLRLKFEKEVGWCP